MLSDDSKITTFISKEEKPQSGIFRLCEKQNIIPRTRSRMRMVFLNQIETNNDYGWCATEEALKTINEWNKADLNEMRAKIRPTQKDFDEFAKEWKLF